MYCTRNFQTKKALREAVYAYNAHQANKANTETPHPVTVFQPGPFGGNEPTDGTVCLEGPHYPQPHRWYAEATLENGVVTRVK